MNVFIFRRDLRIEDNTALLSLVSNLMTDDKILPVFIFNTAQISPSHNQFYSNNCVQFMIQSLQSLAKHIPIQYFETSNDLEVLEIIHKKECIKSIYFNIDFTPFAIKRDEAIIAWCKKHDVVCKTFEDYTLLPINAVMNNTGSYYSVYTPFYRKFLSLHDKIPPVKYISNMRSSISKHIYTNKYIGNIKPTQIKKYYTIANTELLAEGGRENGLKLLDRVKDKSQFSAYDKNRDYPSIDGTTRLSPYLKFGCISIREVYEAIKKSYGLNHGLIRELIWRDFYANIVFNKPRVLNGQIDKKMGNLSFKDKYDNIQWIEDNEKILKWCKGETGFPIVDAAMRQLNTTGWMHNRCRMIVACFLIKDLLIDWRKGEQYFATKLIDYDPSSNNGGWQFCSSTGVDAQPYFRIFNPFTQSKKFDADAVYIKHWVHELKDVPAKDIHSWNVTYKKYINSCKYPEPMVEHSVQSKKAIHLYKNALA